jgi:hypothetical protein
LERSALRLWSAMQGSCMDQDGASDPDRVNGQADRGKQPEYLVASIGRSQPIAPGDQETLEARTAFETLNSPLTKSLLGDYPTT